MHTPADSAGEKHRALSFIVAVSSHAVRGGGLGALVTGVQLLALSSGRWPSFDVFLDPSLGAAQNFFISHVMVFLGGTCAASVSTVVAGLGLSRRKEWARLLMRLILWLVAALMAFQLVLPFTPLGGRRLPPGTGNVAGDAVGRVILVVVTATMVAFGIFCVWTARRLGSPAVRAAFTGARREGSQ